MDLWNLLFFEWDYLYRSLCHSGWQEKGRPVQGQQAAEENYETEIWWQRKYVTMFLWHEYVLFFKLAQNLNAAVMVYNYGVITILMTKLNSLIEFRKKFRQISHSQLLLWAEFCRDFLKILAAICSTDKILIVKVEKH